MEREFCSIYFQKLKEEFGDKVKNTIEFNLPNGNAFVPDAAYIDYSTGLCIDIEIDEPYTIPDGMIIHQIGGKDGYRNSYFAGKGWFVIRFAEEQVARYSSECVHFIKEFISQIKEGTIPSFNHPIDRWSYADALELLKQNYRQTY